MQKRVAKDGSKKVAAFFKRNIYYVLMVVCVIAIGAMITVAAVVNSKGGGTDVVAPPIDQPDPIDPTVKPEEFILQLPVVGATMAKNFNDSKLLWDETTKQFKTHTAVDFKASAGTNVTAVFGGIIESVSSDDAYGMVVVIDHKNGYKTTYKLLSDCAVTVGKTIAKGDVLGKVSKQMIFERAEGEHVHIELRKSGNLIDPMQFVPGDNK